jgi:hypothetical protein
MSAKLFVLSVAALLSMWTGVCATDPTGTFLSHPLSINVGYVSAGNYQGAAASGFTISDDGKNKWFLVNIIAYDHGVQSSIWGEPMDDDYWYSVHFGANQTGDNYYVNVQTNQESASQAFWMLLW